MSKVSMRDLMSAGVHFGHQTRYWNPKMEPYIYAARNKIHILDLEKTLPLFDEAINFVSQVAARKGRILFVGTKRSAQSIIKEEAIRCNMPFVNHRWLGGMLTNYKTVRNSIKRLKDLEAMREKGEFEKLIKKEALTLTRELNKLDLSLGGIKNMGGLPDAIFVVDVSYERIAITEANRLKIPVIGIVDSNCDFAGVDYVIPGNDDALKAIRLYAGTFADTILDGRVTAVGATSEKDEFIEVDAKSTAKKATAKTTGSKPAAEKGDDAQPAKKATAKTTTKTTAKKATAKTTAKKATTKTTAKKATAKTSAKKTTAKDAGDSESSSAAEKAAPAEQSKPAEG